MQEAFEYFSELSFYKTIFTHFEMTPCDFLFLAENHVIAKTVQEFVRDMGHPKA